MNIFIVEMMRCNNFTDQNLEKAYEEIWEKAKQKLSDDIDYYGVYTDYVSNYKGDYSFGVGALQFDTPSLVCIDDTMKYKIFRVKDKTHLPALWQHIWDLEEKNEIKRAYTVDYEHYKADGSVDVHIAIED